MNNKALAKGLAKVSVAVLVLSLVAFSAVNIVLPVLGVAAVPTLQTTDIDGNPKTDFDPADLVYIHGTGFNSSSPIFITITRPDGMPETCDATSCDTRFNGLQTSSEQGDFVYVYLLDGIEGLYTVDVTDGTNPVQTTFTDAEMKIDYPSGGIVVTGIINITWHYEYNPTFGPFNYKVYYKSGGPCGQGDITDWNLIGTKSCGTYTCKMAWNTTVLPNGAFCVGVEKTSGTYRQDRTASTFTINNTPPAPTCGNGIVEGTEQCETPFGLCCDSATCMFKPAQTGCRASGGVCDPAETCTGASAACPADAKSTTECRASAGVCDVAENCNGVNNDCPQDVYQPQGTDCGICAECNVAGSCVYDETQDGDCSSTLCPDGCGLDPDDNPFTWDSANDVPNECTAIYTCSNKQCSYTHTCSVHDCGAQCDATHACTATECDNLDGCVGKDYYDYTDVPNACLSSCNCENNACGTPTISYNDSRCTECQVDDDCNRLDKDYCDDDLIKHDEGKCVSYACVAETTTTQNCDDGAWCNGEETCSAAKCVQGTQVDCSDAFDCTADSCDETSDKCLHLPNDAACDDKNVCTDDLCNIFTGCGYTYNTNSCDDGNVCTTNDVCALGTCAGTQVTVETVCDDKLDNDCDGTTDCADTDCAGTAPCFYTRPCGTGTDICTWNKVLPLGSPNCCGCNLGYNTYWPINTTNTATCAFDGNKTQEQNLYISINNDIIECKLNDVVVFENTEHEGCAPADPRNGYTVDLSQNVVSGQNTLVCTMNDRGSMSHFDSCVVQKQCFADRDCDNGLYCDGAETCVNNACVAGTPVICNDGISCTDDMCNEETDSCTYTPDNSKCDDMNACTLDVCDADKGCINTFSDGVGPTTSDVVVNPYFNNGRFNTNATVSDICSNIKTAKYYIGHAGYDPASCSPFDAEQTGTIYPLDDGTFDLNKLTEYVGRTSNYPRDGLNYICIEGQDAVDNWGNCACAYFDSDINPPQCPYNITFNGMADGQEQLVCGGTPQLTATVCDDESNIQGGEYFLDTAIPPIPAPLSGIWMNVLSSFDIPNFHCSVIGASVNTASLTDGTHYIKLRGKDAVENWGKIVNCTGVSFIIDTAAPTTTKDLIPYQDQQHECTADDITASKLPGDVTLTNGCKFVKAGTQVVLSAADPDTLDHEIAGKVKIHWTVLYKVNPDDMWVLDQQGIGEADADVVINLTKDSYHLIKYNAVDACNNNETMHFELDIVDTAAPVTTKTMDGTPIAGDGFTWITQGTNITLNCTDQDPHPSDHVTLYARYKVDVGSWVDLTTADGYVKFKFPEDSVHTLEYYCVDVLGNTEATHTEVDKVDTVAPNTLKAYGTPLFTSDGREWINSSTSVSLTPTDGGDVCHVGVDKTYWRDTVLGSDTPCESSEECLRLEGTGSFTVYTVPFYKPEQSCHLIEYYSVDKLGNTETVKKQCVFVDNSAPVTVKTVDEPKHECTESEKASYGNPDAGCQYITQQTKITLDCDDVLPHPVDNVVLYYRDYLLGQTPPTYTPIQGGFAEIYKTEDSEHVLEFYCVDALGNTNGVHREIDIVDTQKPVSHKDLGEPQHICTPAEQTANYDPLHNPAQTDGCYFITQNTQVALTCTDQQPHPVDHQKIFYRTYLAGTTPPAFTEDSDSVTFTYTADSAHVLEWYCVDALGNQETTHVEYDIVDTQAPVTTKEIVGPEYYNESSGKTYIDGITEIELTCVDPQLHPVDHEVIWYRYRVDDGSWGTWTEYTGKFKFPEESKHELEYYCIDALGNEEQHQFEIDYVDHTKPVTTKTYGTPYYTNGVSEWITSSTPITLTATDGDSVHASGVAATYWRNTLVDERYCSGELDCQLAEGTGNFNAYVEPFYKPGESCHLIEYYSVDHVEKTEDVKKQCVYVENTPPEITKIVSDPKHNCTEAEWTSYGSPDYGCSYITQQTKITLECDDVMPHPVGGVVLYYRDYLLGNTPPAYTAVKGGFEEIYKAEDSEHVLEWYCVDALGNSARSAENPFVEIDIVDTQTPVSQKDIGDPKHACTADEALQYYQTGIPADGCYFMTKQTPITLTCADGQPHPVDHVKIYYRDYLFGTTPPGFTEVDGDRVQINKESDSAHVLEWYCVDALGNTETRHTEYDIVDTQAPVTTKQIVGPKYYDESAEKMYIDGRTLINLTCADGQPHPVDHEKIWYRYEVGEPDHSWTGWTLYEGPFGFPEESKHTLEYYCIDALGNEETHQYEIDYVDKTPPVTTKVYGTPNYENATSEWITSQTPITLSATDGDVECVHCSGVAATYWRNTLVDERYCSGEWDCQLAEGTGDFGTYVEPFYKPEESCHLIEYYSVDHVEKTEEPKKQCVYVDNTPPVPVKTVGKPRTLWDGSDAIYYNISDKCWNNASDSIDCWKITTMTPVYLDCADPQPHPVDHEQTCFKVSWDGDDVTPKYCDPDHYNGDLQKDGFCCVFHDGVATEGFLFKEECEHELEYYCKDALGNTGPIDEEKFKVEGTSFDIQLNKKWNLISVPFTMLDNSIDEVFKDIENSVEGVWAYDAATDQWFVYKPGGGPNTLHEMKPGWGYWVLMKEPALLKIGGTLFGPSTTPPQRQLVPGWNLIGYYGTDGLLNYTGPAGAGRTSYCALMSLIDTSSSLPRWSALVSYWQLSSPLWQYLDLNSKMDPGAGYWINMNLANMYTFSTVCVPAP